MANGTNTTLQGFRSFISQEVERLPPQERRAVVSALEQLFEGLQDKASQTDRTDFPDLIGFGTDAAEVAIGDIPQLRADFDDAVTVTQLDATSKLYFLYQHERMGVFRVLNILCRMFHEGRIRVHRGPGARRLYLLEKWQPLRYGPRDRLAAYKRVFNYGRAPRPAGAIVNVNFHYQLVALMSALAQYYRDITIGEVIRGSQDIENRPYGTQATIIRIATDLRYALDRASYGNIVALAHESSLYLKELLDLFDMPDIKKAFDANNKWDVVEQVLNRSVAGGARELSQRAKMAEAGREVLQWAAHANLATNRDPASFQIDTQKAGANAEAWIAAYRMTDEGRRFPGVGQNLRWAVGLPDRDARLHVA
ncbi:hypothetical protein [Methylobacterium nonmethylotrophicum]|uniref:Uncharacterized protein n=1 Tax=Methylobacterium nonmethylotrophicum TaxID=1141884 RepID=A0A4Z0NPX5_9HYPH|nr:hypothetical protein [Methylobacterium nonmethylotrophicum]TGD98726.1 hypothetical protein EU555_15450 [Methylobacterium nonmethylotrophicum]